MASNWISYNELAWTEDFLADPKDYENELNGYIGLINSTAKVPVNTVLHLGCGSITRKDLIPHCCIIRRTTSC